MKEKSPQELRGRELHSALFVAVCVIPPSKSDLLSVKAEQAMVGDRDPVRVSAQVAQYLGRAAESRLCVDHPVLTMLAPEQSGKLAWLGQDGRRAGTAKPVGSVQPFESVQELAAEYLAEYFDGQEEAVPGMDPSAVIGRKTARGDHTMDMRVQQQVLSPRVENADDPDLRAEVPGIGSHFESCRGTGPEQQIVEQLCIFQRQHVEFVRHGENDMEITGRQHLALTCSQPAFARLSLTFRAMPVAARVVGDGLMAASGTGIEVAAQRRRPAVQNRAERLELLEAETSSVPVQKAVALCAEDIGHLHGGPAHFCLLRW